MELWLAASLFFGGALCYGIVAKVMDIGHSYEFVKKTTDQVVMLLISTSQDVAFIKSIKYETMESMDIPDEQVELVKRLDAETFRAWKEITFLKMAYQQVKALLYLRQKMLTEIQLTVQLV